jgi:hypothetical protein
MSDIDLGNNPITGTSPTADEREQIRAALGLNNFVDKDATQTLTNKTLNSVNITGTTFGQLDLHNQLPNLNTSALTRSALLSEMCQHFLTPISWNAPLRSGPYGSMEATQTAFRLAVDGGSVASSTDYAFIRGFYPTYHNTGSGNGARMNGSTFSLFLDVYTNGLKTVEHTEFRFLYGIPTPNTSVLANVNSTELQLVPRTRAFGGGGTPLPAGSFGIYLTRDLTGQLQIHDGTTLHTQTFSLSSLGKLEANAFWKFMFVWKNNSLYFYAKRWGQFATPGRWSLVSSLAVPSGVTVPIMFAGDEFVVAACRMNNTANFTSNIYVNSAYTAPFDASPLV